MITLHPSLFLLCPCRYRLGCCLLTGHESPVLLACSRCRYLEQQVPRERAIKERRTTTAMALPSASSSPLCRVSLVSSARFRNTKKEKQGIRTLRFFGSCVFHLSLTRTYVLLQTLNAHTYIHTYIHISIRFLNSACFFIQPFADAHDKPIADRDVRYIFCNAKGCLRLRCLQSNVHTHTYTSNLSLSARLARTYVPFRSCEPFERPMQVSQAKQ